MSMWWTSLEITTLAYGALLASRLAFPERWIAGAPGDQATLAAGAWLLAVCSVVLPGSPFSGRVWSWHAVGNMFRTRHEGYKQAEVLPPAFWVGASAWLCVPLWWLPVADEMAHDGGRNLTALAAFFTLAFEGPPPAAALGGFARALFAAAWQTESIVLSALFMTMWRPSTRSADNSCGIRQG